MSTSNSNTTERSTNNADRPTQNGNNTQPGDSNPQDAGRRTNNGLAHGTYHGTPPNARTHVPLGGSARRYEPLPDNHWQTKTQSGNNNGRGGRE